MGGHQHIPGRRVSKVVWQQSPTSLTRRSRLVALASAVALVLTMLTPGTALADPGKARPPGKDRATTAEPVHRPATGPAVPAASTPAASPAKTRVVAAPPVRKAGPPLPAARLVLTPRRTFANPGQPVTYTAVALDASGRRIGDVTTRTRFSIAFTASAGSTARKEGSCAAATCTARHLGRYTVTGALAVGAREIRGAAELQIVPRPRPAVSAPTLASIEISPASATISSGGQVTYVVEGYDRNHRPLGDVTARTTFSITPDGSCAAAVCTAAVPGRHSVTGVVRSVQDTATDQVELFVEAATEPTPPTGPTPPLTPPTTPLPANAPVASVRIAGTASTITAGDRVTYAATGLDRSGRPVVDLTPATVFRITAPGRCDGRVCTATKAGSFTVVGTVTIPEGTFRGSATLHVVPGPLERLSLSPERASVVAGRGVSFHASGTDAFGNSLGDVTSRASFTMSSPGRCTGSTCSATQAREYTVNATARVDGQRLTGSASVLVAPGPVRHLAISPSRASAQAGTATVFRAAGSDAYGNAVGDLTDRATFTMTAPGTCTGDSCTATRAQRYVVTGSLVVDAAQVVGTAVVDVAAGPLSQLQLEPHSAVATARTKVAFRAHGSDAFGNRIAEVTDTTLVVGPDGTCADGSCSAPTIGPHVVSVSAALDSGTVTADANLLVVATDIAGLRLNPRSAQLRPDQLATFSAAGLDRNGSVIVDLSRFAEFSISPDGQCTSNTCTAGTLGKQEVTATLQTPTGRITDVVPVEVIPKTRVPDQVPGEVASIQVSPKIAQADAGAAITYVATGVDIHGTPIADLTARTTFTIRPDGSCTAAKCVATIPGPHTVTGTFDSSVAAGGQSAGVTVSRAAPVRPALRLLAASPLTAEASVDVRAGPGSCLVSSPDLKTLTATTRPTDRGSASLRVDGSFDARFASCPVVVLVDGRAVEDVTRVERDGTIVAVTTVATEPPRDGGTVAITAIDGRALRQVAFTIPRTSPAGPSWVLWLLLGLALIAAATVTRAARGRRQRRWVAQHVRLAPATSQGSVSTGREPDSGPSIGIRLVPASSPARITISTEEDR